MLAIRLHKRKRPGLGKGAYLIPIISWDTGKIQVHNWRVMLDRYNTGRPNNHIRYITLVRLPADLTVSIHPDWTYSYSGAFDFRSIKEIPQELKHNLAEWRDGDFDRDSHENGPDCPLPELVLGEPLPKSCILWTKDFRLLYRARPTRRHSDDWTQP